MTRNNINCSVVGCHSKQGRERELHFHLFPKVKSATVKVLNAGQEELLDVRKVWEAVALLGKPASKFMRVCSRHFTKQDYIGRGFTRLKPRLLKTAVPSLHLPTLFEVLESENKTLRQKLYYQRGERRRKLSNKQIVGDLAAEVPCQSGKVFKQEESENKREYKDLTEDEKVVLNNLLSLSNSRLQVDKAVQVSSGDIFMNFVNSVNKVFHIKPLPGMDNYDLLGTIIALLSDCSPDKKIQELSIKAEPF